MPADIATSSPSVIDLERRIEELSVENARLRTEQHQALEQQTATAEVLQVINASPGRLEPVFKAMLEKAMSLCEASFGGLTSFDGARFHTLAFRGLPAEVAEVFREPWIAGSGSYHENLVRGESVVHADFAANNAARLAQPQSHALAEIGGARSGLVVALRKDAVLLGSLWFYRREVRPFSDKQIALLQNFAAQAVIAMENARLLGELRERTDDLTESLEYQTATSELLEVISRSTSDIQPVLDTMLASAARLCGTRFGTIAIRQGDAFSRLATLGYAPEVEQVLRSHRVSPGRGSVSARVLLEKQVIQVADLATDPEFDMPELVRFDNLRTTLGVPLLRDGEAIGVIAVSHNRVEPFTERQIALVKTFADQAVIAMENARLLSELTRREQELSVTFEHMGDGVLMLDAELRLTAWNRNFQRLLDVPDAFLATRPILDDYIRLLVERGDVGEGNVEKEIARYRTRAGRPWSTERTRADGRVIEVRSNPIPSGGSVVIYSDITRRKRAEGEIAAARDAAETALERQTATADILRVIAGSPSDVQPVFDAIAERSNQLIGGRSTAVYRLADDMLHLMSMTSISPEADASLKALFPMPLSRSPSFQEAIRSRDVQRVSDVELEFTETPDALAMARLRGWRSLVLVPLMQDGEPIGLISVTRAEPGLIADEHVELLKTFAAQAVIAIRNARLFNELREALEQQTATSEILQVISESPTDVKPVLDAVANATLRFCGANDVQVCLREADNWFVAVHLGPLGSKVGERRALNRETGPGRAIADGKTVHLEDVQGLDPVEFAEARQLGRTLGFNSALCAPMMRDDVAIGGISLRRPQTGPFSDRQVALLESFAAQAVIAIENVRLFRELEERNADLTEALEQQTATSAVLKAISHSAFDLGPVFEAVVENAVKLCEAERAFLFRFDGSLLRAAASYNVSPTLRAWVDSNPIAPGQQSVSARAALEHRTVHVYDVQADAEYDYALRDSDPIRTILAVPMLKGDSLIGTITIYKLEVSPFTDKQIALVETFAAQAVIAIENVRLLTELRDALEQQTATAEILRVISQSPTDVQPVLKAVARAAQRFCGAEDVLVALRDGEHMLIEDVVLDGSQPDRRPLTDQLSVGRAILEGQTVHQPDIHALDPIAFAYAQATARKFGYRAAAAAPMLREGVAIGSILLTKPAVGPFMPGQIGLLEAFAAQAVIAIENVRLFTELRDSLDRQSAMAEVLQAINRSPGELGPVFDAILDKAMALCDAAFGTFATFDGQRLNTVATRGVPETFARFRRSNPPTYGPGTGPGRLIAGEDCVHDIDAADSDAYRRGDPSRRAIVDLGGARTILNVSLRKDGALLGAISIYRQVVRPFSDSQIALLQAFAAQAVIAIESARLFIELREALEQQTATAEILRVISRSPTDVNPVLTAVAKAALKFCGALDAIVVLRDEDNWFTAAHEGPIEAVLKRNRRLTRGTPPGRAILDGKVVQIPDLQSAAGDEFQEGREIAGRMGFRSVLVAPLLRDDVAIGAISLRRTEAGPFTSNQVELLKSFAAQAVIAIENVRLFTELRDSLERLKAAQANLIQAEKMASLGQLTAGIAHEIKNPLNFVNNFAGLSGELLEELKQAVDALLAAPDDDKRAELQDTLDLLAGNLARIAEHGRRADGIVKSMLAHSRGGSGDWQSSNINGLVEEAINLAYHGARAQDQSFNATLELDLTGEVEPVDVVPQDITRVFLNLFGNAFYAIRKRQRDDGGNAYRPTLKVSTRDVGETVEIRIRDNGTGIAPDVRAKLFQPFFTTKPTGEGTGLGLSISYDIVTQQHGGSIEVESEPGQYTEFTVRLPRARRAAA